MSINDYAKTEDKNTNPGYVILNKIPSKKIYDDTVHKIVKLNNIEAYLKKINAIFKGYKNGRGLIGATAAISWLSNSDKTYELITYRDAEKWGTKRVVDNESVKKMDNIIESSFDNFDYKNNHNRLVPNSPCPILYGIRGDITNDLIKAKSIVKSESINGWIIFESNQGTDDHLKKKKIKEIKPFESVITQGKVMIEPYTIKGGHVIFSIGDNHDNKIDCAAYEPTKEFRNIIRELIIGDTVEVYGGIREKPLTINIEKIFIKNLAKGYVKLENPICTNCNKHMKSIGKNQGYKCNICGKKSNKPIIIEKKRNIKLGFYEVPVCSRRHLSKPIKRIL